MMKLDELRKLAGLDEALEEAMDHGPTVASDITKILGLLRIQSQKVERRGKAAPLANFGSKEYLAGWADCEFFINNLLKKEIKGVKPFRRR